MLSSSIIEKLNKQINLEQYSENLYRQMSAWCDLKGYSGSAEFLRAHADDEHLHMTRLFKYVAETGAMPVLGAITAPPIEFGSLADVFKQTLEHEKKITASINSLVEQALSSKDFSTFQFLQWYVAEQHEEERLFQSIIDKMSVIGVDGRGVYFLDKEIRKLTEKTETP